MWVLASAPVFIPQLFVFEYLFVVIICLGGKKEEEREVLVLFHFG